MEEGERETGCSGYSLGCLTLNSLLPNLSLAAARCCASVNPSHLSNSSVAIVVRHLVFCHWDSTGEKTYCRRWYSNVNPKFSLWTTSTSMGLPSAG